MAVTITAADLASRISGLSDGDVAVELLAVGSALVVAYASGAPDEIHNASVVRLAGWLHGTRSDELESIDAGNLKVSWRSSPSRNSMRLSGATSLLSFWHRPRSLIVEDDAT